MPLILKFQRSPFLPGLLYLRERFRELSEMLQPIRLVKRLLITKVQESYPNCITFIGVP